MLEVFPEGYSVLLEVLGEDVARVVPELSTLGEYDPAVRERPFVQIDYNDVAPETIDSLLGEADLLGHSSIVGFPRLETKRVVGGNGDEVLLFPCQGLAEAIGRAYPALVLEAETAGGTEHLLAQREVSAVEYFVLGLIECLSFCRDHQLALVFRF